MSSVKRGEDWPSIVVNWNFRSGEDEAHLTYSTAYVRAVRTDESGREQAELPLDRVVPLGSSVLAPGLSLPIPAR
jgi:hypothetical protein